MVRDAATLHAAAVESVNRGRHARALTLLDAASASAPEELLRARIDGTRALVLARMGDLGGADELVRSALATPGLDSPTQALLRGQRGTIAERAGRLDEAERWLSRAIGAMDDGVPRAHLLVNRSSVRMQRGRLEGAARDCAEAERIYAEHGRLVDAAEAGHNGGYVALLRGDLLAALELMARARLVLADVSPVTAAVCDLDRAAVLRDAGASRDAERLLRRAGVVFGRARMPRDRADTELQLARLLLVSAPRRAATAAAAAERRYQRLGNGVAAARAAGVRVRARLAAGAAPARGAETVASMLDDCGLADDAAALRFARLIADARAASLRGGAASGRGGAAPGRVPRIPRSAGLETRLLAAEARATRASAAGRGGAGRRHAAAGLDLLSEWQHTFGSLDLQSSVAAHGAGLVRAGLAAAARSGRPDVVFEWSERARQLHQQVTPLRPPPDPELAADLAELRRLRAEGAGWELTPRATALRERARDRQWAATAGSGSRRRAELEEVRAQLGPDAAHLAFVFTGDGLTVLVVTDASTSVRELADWPRVRTQLAGLRADLDMAAGVRAGPLADVVRRSLSVRLGELSALLLAEASQLVGDRRVVLAAPGVLAGVPWAMLPGLQGRTFTLVTSATRWISAERRPATPARAGFAVGPGVARGQEEVSAAAAAWRAPTILEAPAATVDATIALAATSDVLHVAAHGRHAGDTPLLSGLELADGTLFGYDVDLVPRVPGVVLLSSCEVGRSSVRGGEEAIGMTRVWLHAGTRAVVATPVVVADDDACELLTAVHVGLAAGRTPSVALAAASVDSGLVTPFQVYGDGF